MSYKTTKRFHLGALMLSRSYSEGCEPLWSATLGARLFGTGCSAAKALQTAASNIMRRAEGLAQDFVPEAGCDAFSIGIDDADALRAEVARLTDDADRLRRGLAEERAAGKDCRRRENERYSRLNARFDSTLRQRRELSEQNCELRIRLDEARRALALLSPNPPETPAATEADAGPDTPAVFVVWCDWTVVGVPASALPKEPGPLDAAMFYHNRTPRTALAHAGNVSDPAGAVFTFTRGPGHAFVWHGRVEP